MTANLQDCRSVSHSNHSSRQAWLVFSTCSLISLGLSAVNCSLTAAAPDDKQAKTAPGRTKECTGQTKCPTETFSKPYGSHLQAILEAVQATAEQRSAITSIVETFRPKIDPLRQVYRQKRTEFLSAITSGLAADEVMVKQNDLSQLYSDISCQYCQMSLEVRRQLKPDQIVQYEEYRRTQGWSRVKK
jgi:hypothetical protein